VSDAELVAQARSGDHAAFGWIVARYQRPLVSAARVTLGPRSSRDDAEDAVQDALVLAYVHLRQFQDPARLGPWLRRVSTNACARLARTRRPSVPLDALAEAAAPGGKMADDADERLLVEGALACLSEETRLTVTLFYRRELSLEEIAAFQEVPVTTIKSRLRNARHGRNAIERLTTKRNPFLAIGRNRVRTCGRFKRPRNRTQGRTCDK
jgi:RNA polymerase sigma factor (sigma-70 family)